MRQFLSGLLLALLACGAEASVISTMYGPDAVAVGGSATLSVDLSVASVPATELDEKLYTINYTFTSGDGDSFSGWQLVSPMATSFSLSTSFVYDLAGIYTPTFEATVTTQDRAYRLISSGYTAYTTHEVCDFFFIWCWSYTTVYDYYWVDTSYWGYTTDYFGYGVSDRTTLAVSDDTPESHDVPLPGTQWLVATGLALLVMSQRRRWGGGMAG